MNPHLLIITIGLCYIVIFGAGALLTGTSIHPILFLVFIYLISMRVRLLVDLASLLSGRGRQRDAISLLQLALRLFPDRSARLIVLVNMGIVQLRRQNPQSAQALLESVLEDSKGGGLGIKYEAACRYNLGVALQRQGKEVEAIRCFNETIGTFPNSLYAVAAQRAIEQRRRGKAKPEPISVDAGTSDQGRKANDE
jgi:tetratricopeptide (TPR) repeat protein